MVGFASWDVMEAKNCMLALRGIRDDGQIWVIQNSNYFSTVPKLVMR